MGELGVALPIEAFGLGTGHRFEGEDFGDEVTEGVGAVGAGGVGFIDIGGGEAGFVDGPGDFGEIADEFFAALVDE